MNEKLEQFLDWVGQSEKIVFFGGAGVSTESGVPDFRSKDGLYNQQDVRFEKYKPEYLLSHSCLIKEPKVYFEFHRQKMDTRAIEPNNAHKYLVKLEQLGKLKGIVTQNIDGLHQKAGSKNVYEIHGSALRNYCVRCNKGYDKDYIFDSKEAVPYCECGGLIRPDITLYEEALPQKAVECAVKCILEADMLIIGGTSLTVYPAATYIDYFKGRYLVVINRDSLNIQPNSKTLIINERIGEFFARAAQAQGFKL
ncbi:MAG: NAD-dependent protein deacylase [Eubacteriales bacterium]|nr:NAD-dependent protein deacylase [Eubacteriales bacterium]